MRFLPASILLLGIFCLNSCRNIDQPFSECENIEDIVVQYCGSADQETQKYFSCFAGDADQCTEQGEYLQQDFEFLIETSSLKDACDSIGFFIIAPLYQYCDATKCPNYSLDCPDSQYYWNSINGSYYFLDGIFNDCATWDYKENINTGELQYSVCLYGECLSKEEIREEVCER
ncbi:MAG: hypothetical protein JXR91_05285 [Deltaproteobacteria bacterium]|nr:hypothetical protein [Deltaproteobacteria bacterium]